MSLEPCTVEHGKLQQEVYGWTYVLPQTENRSGVEIKLSPAEPKSKARWRIDVQYLCDNHHHEDHPHNHDGDTLYIKTDAGALMQFGYLVYGSESRAEVIEKLPEPPTFAELLGAAFARSGAVPMAGSPTGSYKTITTERADGNYL